MIRSAGGCSAIKESPKAGVFIKSDERIPGNSEFVESVLADTQETLGRKYTAYFEISTTLINEVFGVSRIKAGIRCLGIFKQGYYLLKSIGTLTEKRVPFMPSLITLIDPLWASVAILQKARPRPVE